MKRPVGAYIMHRSVLSVACRRKEYRVCVISPVLDFNVGYGFTAIIVAFLGRLHPIGILFAGLLMSLTYVGGELAQFMLSIPAAAIQVFQGMLLFFLLSTDLLVSYKVSFNLGINNSNPKSKSE